MSRLSLKELFLRFITSMSRLSSKELFCKVYKQYKWTFRSCFVPFITCMSGLSSKELFRTVYHVYEWTFLKGHFVPFITCMSGLSSKELFRNMFFHEYESTSSKIQTSLSRCSSKELFRKVCQHYGSTFLKGNISYCLSPVFVGTPQRRYFVGLINSMSRHSAKELFRFRFNNSIRRLSLKEIFHRLINRMDRLS